MAYNIIYKGSVKRDLKKLDRADARRLLDRIEKELSETPELSPVLKGEFAGLRKHRIGQYRVIFAILADEVVILRIAHRKDVYR